MIRGMRKTRRLKVIRYADSLIELNEYLAFFPASNMTDKIGVTDINKLLLNSMLNSWSE